jgi:hypothetical protein
MITLGLTRRSFPANQNQWYYQEENDKISTIETKVLLMIYFRIFVWNDLKHSIDAVLAKKEYLIHCLHRLCWCLVIEAPPSTSAISLY